MLIVYYVIRTRIAIYAVSQVSAESLPQVLVEEVAYALPLLARAALHPPRPARPRSGNCFLPHCQHARVLCGASQRSKLVQWYALPSAPIRLGSWHRSHLAPDGAVSVPPIYTSLILTPVREIARA